MTDHPHIDEVQEQAALYALGALGGDEGRRFRMRYDAGCPLCRALVSSYESVPVALALSVPEAAPPDDLRERLLERIGGDLPSRRKQRGAVLLRASQTPWVDAGSPGIEKRELRGGNTILLRMAPGTRFPAHEHTEAEECLILEGSVESEGVTAYAGDYIYMPKGSRHAALYSEAGCTMLLAYTA